MLPEAVQEKILHAPERPGVYIFKDARGSTLYIGKAKNLRARLRTYLQPTAHPRLLTFLKKVHDLEVLITESEAEALLLEANLIKRQQPRYNIRLKDDKKYPYIKVTVQDPYPRIYPTRNLTPDGSLIFGPYTSASSMRQALRLIRKLFPIRTCKYKLPSKRTIRPCIDYAIGKCLGPCFREDIQDTYRSAVQGVIEFLSGKTEALESRLETEMKQAAESLEFERAAVIRDQLLAVRGFMGDQRVVLRKQQNQDIIAIAKERKTALVLVLMLRGGKVVNKEHFLLDLPHAEATDVEILEHFIRLYYSTAPLTADTVILPEYPEGIQEIQEMVRSRGRVLVFRLPHASEHRLMALAQENAKQLLESELRWKLGRPSIPESLYELQRLLKLPEVPVRILAFDISQLFGKHAVGSSVEFRMGKPYKSGYRRYRIKRVSGIDDYAMMREVVERRFRRELEGSEDLPGLVLIDGGIGQVRAAREALDILGIEEEVRLVGLAKRLDELHLEDGAVVMLPAQSPALKLLQRIRDEAHRFALKYHQTLRSKGALESLLDTLPGVGEARKQALIRYFGSLHRLMGASPREIAEVPMIGPKLAEKIYRALHGE